MNTFTFEITLGTGRYGGPRPQILVRAPRGTPHRSLSAVLHRLAAEAEMATPPTGHWVINIEQHADTAGEVYAELVEEAPAEVQAALEAMRRAYAAYLGRGAR